MNKRAAIFDLILLSSMLAATAGLSAIPQGMPTAVVEACRSGTRPKAEPDDCLEAPRSVTLNGASSWKLVRSKGTKDTDSLFSIMKTADTLRSDPDFAGLMIRCATQGKIDVLMVLVRPFPPQSKPQITVATGQESRVFEGKMAAAGAAIVLPDEAGLLAGGPWQTAKSLSLSAREGGVEIKGVVVLEGLRPAYNNLVSNCTQ